MKTTITNWLNLSKVNTMPLDDIMPELPRSICRRIRNIEEYKVLPDTVVKYGFEYRKNNEYVLRRTYPYPICIRSRSRCTACASAETDCEYKLTGGAYAVYTRK